MTLLDHEPKVLDFTGRLISSIGFNAYVPGLAKGSMTQAYMGRHTAVVDRLREVQESVSAALTAAMNV